MKKNFIPLLVLFCVFPHSILAEQTQLKIGVLPFGTLNWELAVIKDQKLDEAHKFTLNLHTAANPQAGKIALQADAVDVIVSDWIWVNRQRKNGSDFTFFPYSNTAGVLIVPADSPIQNLADLTGKRLGIAGGELDKNWVLLKAVAQKRYGIALDSDVDKIYGAPPLLNQQLMQGRIDALITYWHYGARLEAKGYRRLLDGHDLVRHLEIQESIPPLGYVFKEKWAKENTALLTAFLAASRTAKNLICEDDSVWLNVIPLTRAADAATSAVLRKHYCQGLVKQWSEKERAGAQRMLSVLQHFSGGRLTEGVSRLEPGTFWSGKIN